MVGDPFGDHQAYAEEVVLFRTSRVREIGARAIAKWGVMSHEVGVWIDHKKAVIVSISAGQVTVKTLESEVGPHPHYSGSQESGGEKKYEERHRLHLDRYYDDVL